MAPRNRNDVAHFAGYDFAAGNGCETGAVPRKAAAHDGRVTGCHEGIASVLRIGHGMCRATFKMHVELNRGVVAGIGDGDFSEPRCAGDMTGDEIFYVVQYAALAHGECAAGTFFRRLKEKFDRAAEVVLVIYEPMGECKTFRRMAVVSAGMHQTRVAAGKTELIG